MRMEIHLRVKTSGKLCLISCHRTIVNSVSRIRPSHSWRPFFFLTCSLLALLYIHRCFFAHAISSNPIDPIKSQYAPSFLAGYRSACTIVNAVKQQFTMFSAQIARFWVLWTHAFSASVRLPLLFTLRLIISNGLQVMLSSITIHAPRSKMAPAALLELKIACDLFEDASKFGGRATKFLVSRILRFMIHGF